MTNSRASITATLQAFLQRANKPADDLSDGVSLYADGLGLDSLETAELSATLEDEHGTDPFQQDEMPRTVGDVLDFYDPIVADA